MNAIFPPAGYRCIGEIQCRCTNAWTDGISYWCKDCGPNKLPIREDARLDQLYEVVNHPPHYGGEDNTYEAIKVIEAWGLGFNLGNSVKYICRAGKKGQGDKLHLYDLEKARWYLDRKIQNLEKKIAEGK
jgi:hypothetical protein